MFDLLDGIAILRHCGGASGSSASTSRDGEAEERERDDVAEREVHGDLKERKIVMLLGDRVETRKDVVECGGSVE